MGNPAEDHRRVGALRPGELTGGNIRMRTYTEKDIRRLEAGDLTDPVVTGTLRAAYRQNDPNEKGFVGLRRDPIANGIGTEDELRQPG